jgi:stage II sporulation protein GA (sporulation sigma-E factor processing peptidase)
MIIYIDLVFIINFIFDLLLLLTINIALKRYSKIYRLILGSLVGSLSLISLFISMNAITLCLFKIILGILMCLVSFGYKNIKYTFYNVLYLYMTSIILGGFLYYLKSSFKSNLYYNGISVSYIVLLIISPIILYVFIKSLKVLKEIKNYYYQVEIWLDNTYKLNITGFLDTGNKLKDPITNKPIILINRKLLKNDIHIRSPMYIPYNSLNNHSLLECIKPKKIIINNQELNNYLIGLSNNSFKLNGIECLLNYQILEDIK